jgi:glycine cleavage system H protein
MNNIPEDLKYTSSHEWVKPLPDGTVRVGITDYAQHALGDMVYVELPEVGNSYPAQAECAVVESVKSASDLYCPVSGEVVEANQALSDNAEIVNRDPYGAGWIFRLRPDDLSDLDDLLDADEYAESVRSEE